MEQDICATLLQDIVLPRFYKAQMQIKTGCLTHLFEKTRKAAAQVLDAKRIRSGQTVAIAVGSREIHHQEEMVRGLVDLLISKGLNPFIVPAMGSHGGATAQGQREVLEGYGITEDTMGIPILSSMETKLLGTTPHGIPVHIDAHAASADWIIPVNRIKPHTDFQGTHESGLAKMLAIGLGKQTGAALCHQQGFDQMSRNVREIAQVVLEKAPILLGIGILEDCFHNTWKIAGVTPQNLLEAETELLLEAKSLIPRIPFQKADILILEEIGKDISGAGMDPNITGRSSIQGKFSPFFDRIAVLDLTDKSHGNGVGIGVADVTTRRFFQKFIPAMAYPNAITSRDTGSVRMPPVMQSDLLAVKMAIQTLSGDAAQRRRVVWMRNTLTPDRLFISESLYEDAMQIDCLTVEDTLYQPHFDQEENFIGFEPLQTKGIRDNQTLALSM